MNTLFDIMITDLLVERRNLWRRFHALAEKVPPSDMTTPRSLLTAVPVTSDEALQASLQQQSGDQYSSQAGVGTLERDLVREWRARVSEQIAQAEQVLLRLEQQAFE